MLSRTTTHRHNEDTLQRADTMVSTSSVNTCYEDLERITSLNRVMSYKETDKTWELISNLSKNETTNVHNMILHYYEHLQHKDLEDICENIFDVNAEVLDTNSYHQLTSHYMKYKPEYGVTAEIYNEFNKLFGKIDTMYQLILPVEGKVKMNSTDKLKAKNMKKHCQEELEIVMNKSLSLDDKARKLRIVELIMIYYMRKIKYACSKNQNNVFYNSMLSLRDCIKLFKSMINDELHTSVVAFIMYYNKKVDWFDFFENNCNLLINNHFKSIFDKVIEPFEEQKTLLKTLFWNNLSGLYMMPWGVGCGKTSMVAPLSELIYHKRHMITFYCVSKPPVRDQTAANMYRCGIPFAYVTNLTGKRDGPFEVNPSYHCKYLIDDNSSVQKQGKIKRPYVFLVDKTFIEHYNAYLYDKKEVLHFGDEEEIQKFVPKNVIYPTGKKFYKHIDKNIWNDSYCLILDEPDTTHGNLDNILNDLPQLTFIMSATSCHIINDQVINKYQRKWKFNVDRYVAKLHPKRIGISTTLLGYWLKHKSESKSKSTNKDRDGDRDEDSNVILSPFDGCQTVIQIINVMDRVTDSKTLQRFLSPKVLNDWYTRFNSCDNEQYGFINFDNKNMLNVTFDTIANTILEWIGKLTNIIINTRLNDDWVKNTFGLDRFDIKNHDVITDVIQNELYKTKVGQFSGGTIVGSSSIAEGYSDFSYLQHVDDLLTMQNKLDKRSQLVKNDLKEAYKQKNMTDNIKNKDARTKQRVEAQQLIDDTLEKYGMLQVPVPSYTILNSAGFHKHHGSKSYNDKYITEKYCDEYGDRKEHIEAFRYKLDLTKGIPENLERCRMIGIGSIIDNKEFYMKCINEMNNEQLAFNITNNYGAYGLNLKISNVVLMPNMIDESHEVIMQLVGRVGRINQESNGYVYITSMELFKQII
jgi:hypothetical protein